MFQVTTFNAIVETSYTFKGLRRIPTLRDLLEWGRRLATFGHIRPRATAGFLTLQEREGVVVEVRRTVQVFNSVMYSQPSTFFGFFRLLSVPLAGVGLFLQSTGAVGGKANCIGT